MKRRAVVATGATAMGAVLLLSGCNADGEGTTGTENMKLSAGQALLKTSEKAGRADTFKAALTVTGSGNGEGRIHATGQFRVRPELTFSARLDEVTRDGQAVPGAKGQAVFTGGVLYAKVPQPAQFVSGGKPWVRIDVDQVAQRTGFDARELIRQVEKVAPAEQTKMFTGSRDVRRVGAETIDGVRTTHYTGTVTVEDGLKQLDAQARRKVEAWLPKDRGDAKIHFDLWTDGDGLPRKLVSTTTGDQGEKGSVTVRYSDYGKSFTVNAPPADQVGRLAVEGLLGGS